MTWKQEAIEQIDAIFEWLLKVDKWDKMANRLSKLLLGKWNETQKAAIYNALELLGSGTVTKDSLNDVLGSLERSLGKNLADAMREPVATVQTDSYHLAGKDIGVDFEFNRPDRKALDWLERDAMYWIGTHYDRNLRRSMEDSAQEVIRQGMGRLEATAHLKSVFGERFGKADGYWEGLSNHIVTRAREFGRVSAYDQAGVKYFKVIAYLDHRTSSMCRAMNGRIISVDVARAQRDAMMAAKTPEDAKKIAPWYTDKEVKAKVEGKPSGKLPKAVGLPPYHFNCRTRTVIAEDGEREVLGTEEQTVPKPEAAAVVVPADDSKKPLRGENQLEQKARLDSLDGKEYISDKRFRHLKNNIEGRPFKFNSLSDHQQKIISELLDRSNAESDRIGIPRIRGVGKPSGGAMADMGDGRLGWGTKSNTMRESRDPQGAELRKFSSAYFRGADQVEARFWHEYGHHIHQQYGVTDRATYKEPPIEREFERVFRGILKNKSATDYGKKNHKEFFAEHYALVKMGRSDIVPNEFIEYLRRYNLIQEV